MQQEVEGHPRRWWALAVLCLTLGMVALDNSILNVALPHIAAELGAEQRDLQWIVTAYGLVLAGLLLPLAVVGDRVGRRTLLVTGLGLFGLASAVASMADTADVLVLCRGLMGIGGACAMPATLALISNIFPPHEVGRAIAMWSATAGATSAAGPIVGGLLVDRFWWGSVFLVNVPLAAALVVGGLVLVPQSRDRTTPRIDRGSAVFWWAALTATLLAIIEAPERGVGSPLVLAAAAAAIVLLVLFRARERRTDGPLVDEVTARDPRMRAGAVAMAAMFVCILGCQYIVTQWLQGPEGLRAVTAGLCFVPSALASMVLPLASTGLVRRHGHRAVASSGVALLGLGALGVGLAIRAGNVPAVSVAFGLIGAGLGLASPSASELIMSSAPPARAGSAAGVNETIVEAAGALGVAVLGSVLAGSGSFAWPLPIAAAVAFGAVVLIRRTLPG